MRSMCLAVAAAAAAFVLAGCGGHAAPPRATVATCTADIVAHPSGTDPKLWPHCKGLTHDQLVQATIAAMAQGAIG